MILRILLVFTLLIRLEPTYASSEDFIIKMEENSEGSSLIYFAIGVGAFGLTILSYLFMKSPEQRKDLWKLARKYLPGFGAAVEPIVYLDNNVRDPNRYFQPQNYELFIDGTESRTGFLNINIDSQNYMLALIRYQKEAMNRVANSLWDKSKLTANAKHIRKQKSQQKSDQLEDTFSKLTHQMIWISKRLKTAITFLNDESIPLQERMITFMGKNVNLIKNEDDLVTLYKQLNVRIQSELLICTSTLLSATQVQNSSNMYKLYDFLKAYIQHISNVLKKLNNKVIAISEETRQSRRLDLVTYINLFETVRGPTYEYLEPILSSETLDEFKRFDEEILAETADIRNNTVLDEITPFDIYNADRETELPSPEHEPSSSSCEVSSSSSCSSSSGSDSGTPPMSSAKRKRTKPVCREHSEKREGKKEEKKEILKRKSHIQSILTPEQSQRILSTLNSDQRRVFESIFASRDYEYTSREVYSLIEHLIDEIREQSIDTYRDLQAMFLTRKGKEGIHKAHSSDTGETVYGWVHQSIRSRFIRFGLFPTDWSPRTGKDCEAKMRYENAMSILHL